MSLPTEMLMAYVDGELTPEDARRVEAEIAARPDLKAYVDQQLALRNAFSRSFDTILDAPLPERLLEATAQRPSLVWRMTRALKSLGTWRGLMWSGIPAAALACGVAVGVLITAPGSADIVFEHGALLAGGALSKTLSTALSGQPMKTAEAQIGLSFRDKAGRYCRTFATGGGAPLAGVACHQDDAWHVAALAESVKEEDTSAAYALSGSPMPDAIRTAVRNMISGDPLDAAGERKARAAKWNVR